MDKPKTKWTMEEIDYFVHLYKNHECLWNINKSSYNNTSLQAAAFADIQLKMKQNKCFYTLGVDEIKEKINNLLTTYCNLRKTYKYSSFCPSEHAGKWYKHMDFIVKNSGLLSSLDNSNSDPKPLTKKIKTMPDPTPSTSTACDITLEVIEEEVPQHISYQANNKKTVSMRSLKLKSRIAIMNVLKKLYMENVCPSYHIVYDILKKVILSSDPYLTSSVDGFIHEMTQLGYIYKEIIEGKKIIIENAKQRFERYLYLDKIAKVRSNQNKQIVYIDERVINTQLTYEKFKGSLPAESSIFFHAISKDGILNGLFSNSATEEDFSKWVRDILLNLLKTPSVIVMDNNPIHGAIIDTCAITRYSTKAEMLKWLIASNVPCSTSTSRPRLYELIRMNKSSTKEYKIDTIIKSHGHEVLRLPDMFPELNLTDVLWDTISESNSTIVKTKTVSLASLQVLQNIIIESILPSISKKKWYELERTLIMNENEIHSIDVAVEKILQSYVFM